MPATAQGCARLSPADTKASLPVEAKRGTLPAGAAPSPTRAPCPFPPPYGKIEANGQRTAAGKPGKLALAKERGEYV